MALVHGVIVRIWRIWVLNNQVTTVTGVITTLEIARTTAGSGRHSINPN